VGGFQFDQAQPRNALEEWTSPTTPQDTAEG
jgi:hypothetical protein